MASTNRPHAANTLRGILAGVVRSNKLLTAALVVVIAADILLTLVPPLVLEGIVNDLTAGQEISLAVALLYFGAVAGSSAMDALKSASVTVAGQKVTHGLRSAMARKLDRLPAGYFTRHTGGAVSSLFVNDVDTVRALFDEGIVSMAIDVCKVVGIIAVIFTRSIGLGVLLLVVTPFLFLLTRAFQRRMLAAQLANRQAVANMNAQVPETVRVMRTVRNLGLERFMEERYDTCVRDCFASMERVNLYDSVYSPIVVTCGSLVIAAVMVLASLGGGVQEFFGMSVGTAAAVVAYVGKVFEPLGAIGMEIEGIQQAIAGVKRVKTFLDEEERAETDKTPQADAPLAVELAGVDFGYEDGRAVLKDFSLDVAPGEMVTLAGRTGAGKSTIFKLILGDYEPWAGAVHVWGVDAMSTRRSGPCPALSPTKSRWATRASRARRWRRRRSSQVSGPRLRLCPKATTRPMPRGSSPRDRRSCSPSHAPWRPIQSFCFSTRSRPTSTPAPSSRSWRRCAAPAKTAPCSPSRIASTSSLVKDVLSRFKGVFSFRLHDRYHGRVKRSFSRSTA